MKDHTITFAPDGTARCFWTEVVPLQKIGQLEIRRATNIQFNNATQHWEVKDRKDKYGVSYEDGPSRLCS